ncbi:MAG: hypothetical protein ACM30E_07665 [Nitrososphaerales archaeon]
MDEMRIGHLYNLEITAESSALVGTAALATGLAFAARRLAHLSPVAAVAAGLTGALLHWTSDICHQLGHARAARSTGYPMSSLHCRHVLVTSRYPTDEPELPAEIHVRRALGGMPASLALGLAAVIPALALRRRGGVLGFLATLLCLDNLLVLGLGALVPLGFTDGSTLLTWVPRLTWKQPSPSLRHSSRRVKEVSN